ncbi:MAG: hypothetical protein CMO98_08920 [Woeseia sp.]|nr:hypothetical protein [Woeseia sp.]|tara:strand:+ start:526 stop:2115 length:1590 start_codon:yes stop_codon:yes gene_type:complete
MDDGKNTMPTPDLLREAEALSRDGNSQKAEQLCDIVLEREPENIGAFRVLALAAHEDKRYIIAEAFLKRVCRLQPDDVRAVSDLAKFLENRGRYRESIAYLEPIARRLPENPDIQLLFGNMLGIVGRVDDALGAYDRCLEAEPNDPSALIGRGHMLRIVGRTDEALASYRHCTSVNPEFGAAWWYLASLPKHEMTEEEIVVMQDQLTADLLSDDAKIGLHFALARTYEQRKDFQTAWTHYEQGNKKKRELVNYDPVKTETDQKKIRDTFTSDKLQDASNREHFAETPIFILGMPRSGSTLIEQILSSHSSVEGGGELPYIMLIASRIVEKNEGSLHYTENINELGQEELDEFGQAYLQLASTHNPESKAFFTDKMPANFPHAGLIHMLFPQAKIIDARRHPVATCLANYRQLYAQGKNQSYDLTELGEYYLEYIKMMDHWDTVMPGVVLRVDYEDMVRDIDSQVARILDHCGLPFEQSCLDFHKSERSVNTASSEQVREPIYDSALDFWRNYELYLNELSEILSPVMKW